MDRLLRSMLTKDQESVLVWHQLPPHRTVKEHAHDDYDEFVLVINGKFSTNTEGQITEYDLDNELTVIHFPAGVKHSLVNGDGTIDYFVVRTPK